MPIGGPFCEPIDTYASDVDWVVETAFDCGMDVVKLAVLQRPQDTAYRTRYEDRVPVQFAYPPEQQVSDIETLRPDLVVSGFVRQDLPATAHYDTFRPARRSVLRPTWHWPGAGAACCAPP